MSTVKSESEYTRENNFKINSSRSVVQIHYKMEFFPDNAREIALTLLHENRRKMCEPRGRPSRKDV